MSATETRNQWTQGIGYKKKLELYSEEGPKFRPELFPLTEKLHRASEDLSRTEKPLTGTRHAYTRPAINLNIVTITAHCVCFCFFFLLGQRKKDYSYVDVDYILTSISKTTKSTSHGILIFLIINNIVIYITIAIQLKSTPIAV